MLNFKQDAMKLQAHSPINFGPSDRHTTMTALGSLFAAAVLLLALQSSFLLNNSSTDPMLTSPIKSAEIGVSPRVSLGLHPLNSLIDPWRRFSVAHALPNVASSQRFSVAMDERAVFELFGDAALGEMSTEKQNAVDTKSRNVALMLMLLRLNTQRH